MGDSYTNKNANQANYENLTSFAGFYDNRYKEPFITGFSFIFITKPLLFLNPIKPADSSKEYKNKLAWINMTREPKFAKYLRGETLNSLDDIIINMLSYNTDLFPSNFLPIFTNECKTFDTSDTSLGQVEAFDTKQGFREILPTHESESVSGNNLSIQVVEDSNLTFTKTMELWCTYASRIQDGTLNANPDMITNGVLDYTSSIYYFVLEPDGRTLKYWAKYTGCWPTTIPYNPLRYSKGDKTVVDLDINFVYNIKEDMDPKILEDFNRISLNIMDEDRYKKLSTSKTNGYYTPIKDSILLNKNEMTGQYSDLLEKVNKSNHSPIILYESGNSNGINPDKTNDKFILEFGADSYKSKFLEETFEKTLNEFSATGFWDGESE